MVILTCVMEMKRTRRHKYLQVLLAFLMYSLIYVAGNSENDIGQNTKADKANSNPPPKDHDSEAHEHILGAAAHHAHSSYKKVTDTSSPSKSVDSDASDKAENSEAHEHILGSAAHHTHSTFNKGTSSISSSKSTDSDAADKTEAHEHILGSAAHHTHSTIRKNNNENNTEAHEHIMGISAHHTHSAISKNNASAGQINKEAGNSLDSNNSAHHHILEQTGKHLQSVVTNESSCTRPAIEQFPHPIMSPKTRRHGGLIIHVIVAIYMFIGLAIVCDEYFVASLDRICEELKMSPDVAGATFMAAGSSAPELATVIIGVFLAHDDIGISGVIGSAVFNIMFVIACCGLCSSAVIYLNWWPLIRDCFFYAVSILVMLGVIYDKQITWVESVVMLVTYAIYCIVLHFNTPLERFAQTLPVPFKHKAPSEQSGLVSYKTLDDDGKLPNYGMEWSPEKQQQGIADDSLQNFGMEWSPEKHQQGFANQLSGPALNQATTDPSPPPPAAAAAAQKSIQQDYYKPKEYDPSTQVDPLVRPESGGYYTLISWIIVYPIHWLCRKTMPDCRSEKYKNWYPFTFFVSMVWISFYSYFMVWMITVIGYTLGIPDTVMGLTFVAAGVSVPDALSSIAVVKEGYGDMAVSNAVGSNVFDILICLGLPWFIQTAIWRPGTAVKVISKGLAYSTLSLLSTVVFLVVATHWNGWKLDRRYGVILMIWYLIFITFASMYEMNVFGDLNPPECISQW